MNLPLEAYTDPAIYLPAFEAVVPPLLERFQPDVSWPSSASTPIAPIR